MIGRVVEVCPIIFGVVDSEEIADLLVSHEGIGVRSQVAHKLKYLVRIDTNNEDLTDIHTDSM